MIKVLGANEHNLKNLSIEIPKHKLVVFTGVSGSGKSSLVFDTIFREAQREYLESINSYSRNSMPKFSKSNVLAIEGLSPCVVIDQNPLGKNPRSTLGTVTDIYSYIRLLFSRMGTPILDAADFSYNTPKGACKECGGLGTCFEPKQDKFFNLNLSLQEGAILHRKWKVNSRYWNIIRTINIFDFNKPLKSFTEQEMNTLLHAEPQSFQTNAPGFIQDFKFEGIVTRLVKKQGDSRGLDSSYDKPFFRTGVCKACNGSRLNKHAREVRIDNLSIIDLLNMELFQVYREIDVLNDKVADEIKPFLLSKLSNLINLGLGYLTLNRSVSTLSGGESQRVKLAKQLGTSLTELIYVMDEPTLGLHVRDVDKLITIFKSLVAQNNTVLIVEHNKLVMLESDYVIDIGPGAGTNGGTIVAQGSIKDIVNSNTTTGRYLAGKDVITKKINSLSNSFLTVSNASRNNLKNITIKIPMKMLVSITGVSGSGKSSLMEELVDSHSDVILIDQSPIGRNSRGNTATYCKAFDEIRNLFSFENNVNASYFSFNSKGACSECNGLGVITMDMHFLGNLSQKCPSCKGHRYKKEVLEYQLRGKNIFEVLEMTVHEAHDFFKFSPIIKKSFQMLKNVGLDYLTLGQPLSTLSGGENQRLKLATKLTKKGNVYILDEPTKGLHFKDISNLLLIIQKLIDKSNSVIVVEHNMEIIKNSDWIIDLGPEGGEEGGLILFEGTAKELVTKNTSTGKCLKKYLNKNANFGV